MNEQGTDQAGAFHQGGWSGGRCPYCGSSEILTGLEFNLNAEVGPWGLSYKAIAFLRGTEKVNADLCSSCGTIVRTYVKEPKRKWVRR
jgi:DNA-directed RNA polymerase subunit RPC12/RpoP